MRLISTLLSSLIIVGCSITQEKACLICATENPCQPPPELSLTPQNSLTLPPPSATLVKPTKGDPYFRLTEGDFYLWIDNNHKLTEYIRECRTRTDMVKTYYEDGLKPLRERNSKLSNESPD